MNVLAREGSSRAYGPAADGGEFLIGTGLVLLVPGFDEGLVGLIAVALEGAGEVGGHEGFEAVVAAVVVPLVEGVTLGATGGPEVALSGSARREDQRQQHDRSAWLNIAPGQTSTSEYRECYCWAA
jgi:hypothetical protein